MNRNFDRTLLIEKSLPVKLLLVHSLYPRGKSCIGGSVSTWDGIQQKCCNLYGGWVSTFQAGMSYSSSYVTHRNWKARMFKFRKRGLRNFGVFSSFLFIVIGKLVRTDSRINCAGVRKYLSLFSVGPITGITN